MSYHLTCPIRVYADTSVYGGVFDRQFSHASKGFFDKVANGRFLLVVSPVISEDTKELVEELGEFGSASLALLSSRFKIPGSGLFATEDTETVLSVIAESEFWYSASSIGHLAFGIWHWAFGTAAGVEIPE